MRTVSELIEIADEMGIPQSREFVQERWNEEMELLWSNEYEVEENEDGEVEEIWIKENIWNTLLFFLHIEEMRGGF